MPINTIVFDAYGTLYDTQSVSAITDKAYPGYGDAIAQIWRLKQLEYTWLRSLMRQYEDFASVTRASPELYAAAARTSDRHDYFRADHGQIRPPRSLPRCTLSACLPPKKPACNPVEWQSVNVDEACTKLRSFQHSCSGDQHRRGADVQAKSAGLWTCRTKAGSCPLRRAFRFIEPFRRFAAQRLSVLKWLGLNG